MSLHLPYLPKSSETNTSFSRCYTSLAQANDRLGLLSRCNTNTTIPETLGAGEDQDTGCQWCSWTRPASNDNASSFRFYAEVKRVVMQGHIRRDGPSGQEAASNIDFTGGLAATPEYKYSFEHKKDLANHVWVVALHDPSRTIAVDDEGKPTQLPWTLEGVFEASGNAMARGKRLWRDKLAQTQGRFDRLDSHYGFARYLLIPLAAGNGSSMSSRRTSVCGEQQRLSIEGTAQIRVERIKVMPQGEMVAMFAPAEAILFDKPFQPLYKGRTEEKEREAAEKVEADLLSLLSAAGESAAEHNVTLPAPDPRTLTPPPIRRTSLRSPQQKSFRPGVATEYSELAATLRAPGKVSSASKAQKAMNRLSLSKGVASAKKHFYHSMESGSPLARKERISREPGGGLGPTAVPPLTPGEAALAAQQTLLLASRINRG